MCWNAAQYLRFEDERTQPCRDLAGRIMLDNVHRVIDLGCGPGNSTRVLAARWPNAEIIGLDSSAEMIEAARNTDGGRRWEVRDIADWARYGNEEFDLIFSNAALHWVSGHETLFPRLLGKAAGALAVQMPDDLENPAQQLMRKMALSPSWNGKLSQTPDWHVEKLEFYYDLLSPLAARIDLWATEYIHRLPNAEAIVEWYKGSGLRPYLDALPDVQDRERFTAEYLSGIRALYHSRADGRVLFPFRRIFLVAYR